MEEMNARECLSALETDYSWMSDYGDARVKITHDELRQFIVEFEPRDRKNTYRVPVSYSGDEGFFIDSDEGEPHPELTPENFYLTLFFMAHEETKK